MNRCGSLLLSIAVVFAYIYPSFPALGQSTISVDETALDQHVDHRVPPVYPPIAKAAHIQGTVTFEIRVGASGKIESMKVVSGPAMLQQAATDCLKQWTFHPFEEHGAPVDATGQISIRFILGDYHPGSGDEKVAAQYFPLSDQCRKAVLSRNGFPEAERICNKAAETAEEFGPDVRFIEKRSAFVYAATACADNRDISSALKWAQKAVAVVKLGHDDNSGSNAAYSTLGFVEGMSGDLRASDRDLTTAEDFGRKAIAWAIQVHFEHGNSYQQSLERDLRFHAQVLQALDRANEAQKKLDEAEKLK